MSTDMAPYPINAVRYLSVDERIDIVSTMAMRHLEPGVADLRVIEGVRKALETGLSQALSAFPRSQSIDPDAQKQTLSMIDPPEPVHAVGPWHS